MGPSPIISLKEDLERAPLPHRALDLFGTAQVDDSARSGVSRGRSSGRESSAATLGRQPREIGNSTRSGALTVRYARAALLSNDHVRTVTSTHRLFPFGVPDGTPQEGGDDPLKDFVRVRGKQFAHGLGMAQDDRKARVIVGRKGAGKTLYLRRLQRSARSDGSLYADAWQTDHPPTSEVIRVYDLADSAPAAAELWERIWRRALLRSVASHLLCAQKLRSAVAPNADELRDALKDLGSEFRRASPPSHQVEEILFGHQHLSSLESYLDRPVWRTLEALVKEALTDCPPVCLYLDALDEHFESAPRQWLACQLGLCRLVLRMADQFPRMHVVIAIRDLVYSALQASEHRTRYQRMERIRTLDWNYSAIDRLLAVKIDQLPEAYLLGSAEAVSPVERWLGIRTIMNAGKSKDRAGQSEDAKDYLLRHTRLIPRDLVQLGNAMCHLLDKAHDDGEGFVSHHALHQAVRAVSRDAGLEELLVVANHITTTWMPRFSVEMGIESSFLPSTELARTADDSLQRHVRDHLRRLLKSLREDRVSRKRFEHFIATARGDFGDAVDISSLLWQHGLVGYIDGPRKTGKPVFYSAMDENQMTLTTEHDAYALHPIMIDAVGLTGVGDIVRAF